MVEDLLLLVVVVLQLAVVVLQLLVEEALKLVMKRLVVVVWQLAEEVLQLEVEVLQLEWAHLATIPHPRAGISSTAVSRLRRAYGVFYAPEFCLQNHLFHYHLLVLCHEVCLVELYNLEQNGPPCHISDKQSSICPRRVFFYILQEEHKVLFHAKSRSTLQVLAIALSSSHSAQTAN